MVPPTRGTPVGGIGHVGCFSFCQDKIITTGGEGGVFTTNNKNVWRRAWEFKDHGKSYEAVHHRAHQPGFRWLHESFGMNWRMTEMQAAIGRIQLGKLKEWTACRRSNMNNLFSGLANLTALQIPRVADDLGHAAYKAYIYLRPETLKAGWTRGISCWRSGPEGCPALVVVAVKST